MYTHIRYCNCRVEHKHNLKLQLIFIIRDLPKFTKIFFFYLGTWEWSRLLFWCNRYAIRHMSTKRRHWTMSTNHSVDNTAMSTFLWFCSMLYPWFCGSVLCYDHEVSIIQILNHEVWVRSTLYPGIKGADVDPYPPPKVASGGAVLLFLTPMREPSLKFWGKET